MRCFTGKYYVKWVWRNTDGSAIGRGRSEVDFGASPGAATASVAVTGQASIAAAGLVDIETWIDSQESTSDSKTEATVREHDAHGLRFLPGSVLAGTGFTIYARGPFNGEVTPPGGVTCSSGTVINTNIDTTIYTVPSAPTGAAKFVMTGFEIRLSQQMLGTSNMNITLGKTAGGTGFLTAQNITSATAAGADWGETHSQLGSEHVDTKGYNATLSPGDNVILRIAVANSGIVSQQAILIARVFGVWK